MRLGLDVGLDSEAGKRPENQDRVVHFASDLGSVFVLADGMGGHLNGAVASQMAISACKDVIKGIAADLRPSEALESVIKGVNRLIFEQGRSQPQGRGMGTTLVALLISETVDGLLAIGAHVGDSRLYFLRGGKLFRLTEDHSLVNRLMKNGTLTEEEAEAHPQAGVLTRALGREPDIAVDLTSWMLLQKHDLLMLCSDGLSGYVRDEGICSYLQQSGSARELAHGLVQLAIERGSEDNVSVLIVKVGCAEDLGAGRSTLSAPAGCSATPMAEVRLS